MVMAAPSVLAVWPTRFVNAMLLVDCCHWYASVTGSLSGSFVEMPVTVRMLVVVGEAGLIDAAVMTGGVLLLATQQEKPSLIKIVSMYHPEEPTLRAAP